MSDRPHSPIVTPEVEAGETPPAALSREQDELRLESLDRRTAATDCLLILVVGAVAWVFADWFLDRAEVLAPHQVLRNWLVVAAAHAALATGLALVFLRIERLSIRSLGLRLDGWEAALIWGCAAAAAVFVVGIVAILVLFRLAAGTSAGHAVSYQRPSPHPLAAAGLDDMGGALAVMGVAVLAEELLFRGLLLPRLWRLTGRAWLAVALSALAFSLWHVNGGLVPMLVTFLAGLACGTALVASRRLLAPVVAHLLWNGLALQLLRAMAEH